QQHECSVAFISVKDSRLNAQGAQNTHASDAKYNLLSNPMFLVAAVKACGEFPVPMLVFFNIGVHQVERYGTEADAPDDNEYAETANLQLNKESLFGVGAGRFNRRFIAFQQFIDVFLPTVRLNSLMKITLRINEADSDQGNTEVAGFFAMITCKD